MKRLFLKVVLFISRIIGRLHVPFSHRLITGQDFYDAVTFLIPGDVLLSYTSGEASNLFIPGDWKHAAMFVGVFDGVPMVVEAIGQGVIKRDLISFFISKDRIGIWRPLFAGRQQEQVAANTAISVVGYPYDYEFRGDNESFYCSELICWAYDMALDGRCPMEMRERLGTMTVVPSDIALATKKFINIWKSG